MNKSKKMIIAATGIIILIVVVIAMISSCGNGKGEVETTINETTTGETTVDMTVGDEEGTLGDLEIPETDENGEEVTEKDTKKNNKKEDKETTNYWDNMEVIEDVNETETVTDENGEVVPEDYPGQHSGWSPIVKPEDLE